MKYKKSKAIYLSALLLLMGASLVDKLNPTQDKIEVSISVSDFEQSARKYASLSTTNQNDKKDEKADSIDPATNN